MTFIGRHKKEIFSIIEKTLFQVAKKGEFFHPQKSIC